MNKIAILVLAHKEIPYIFQYAEKNYDMNFYVHFDKKFDLDKYLTKELLIPKNVHFVLDRISINWAGFSMIRATLNLIYFSLNHDKANLYFHLISGDDVLLVNKTGLMWDTDEIFIEHYRTFDNRYRLRFNFFYADTSYQRYLIPKIFTQIFKKIDQMLFSNKDFFCGSQWFSIKRKELEFLVNSIVDGDLTFFKKKLCPDEHFFQYLMIKYNLMGKLSMQGNKRYIVFDSRVNNGSSPVFLNLNQLYQAKHDGYWFARKVCQKTMAKFYNEIDNESVK